MLRRTTGEKIFDFFNYSFMIVLCILCLYPLLYVLFASVSDPIQFAKHTGILYKPIGFTLKGYELVLKNPDISRGYMNTLIYVVFGTLVNIIMTSLGAYLLSRKGLYWGKVLMFLVTFTMFFSGGLIPTFLLVRNLGMLNKRIAMIIPKAISVWNLIVMRTAFKNVPDSLEESAKLDGANDFTILFKIILPVNIAVTAVMTLFYSVSHWNSWFDASIYLRDRTLFPLQLILREILIENNVSEMTEMNNFRETKNQDMYRVLVQYCTIIVATIPILLVYPFLQKYFVKGVMIGSIKE